jgi:hypothetical protein
MILCNIVFMTTTMVFNGNHLQLVLGVIIGLLNNSGVQIDQFTWAVAW